MSMTQPQHTTVQRIQFATEEMTGLWPHDRIKNGFNTLKLINGSQDRVLQHWIVKEIDNGVTNTISLQNYYVRKTTSFQLQINNTKYIINHNKFMISMLGLTNFIINSLETLFQPDTPGFFLALIGPKFHKDHRYQPHFKVF